MAFTRFSTYKKGKQAKITLKSSKQTKKEDFEIFMSKDKRLGKTISFMKRKEENLQKGLSIIEKIWQNIDNAIPNIALKRREREKTYLLKFKKEITEKQLLKRQEELKLMRKNRREDELKRCDDFIEELRKEKAILIGT